MKKLICIALIINLCLLTGCVSHVELNKKAIVEAVGIDYDKGNYTVTMQYYNTLGSDVSDISETNVLTAQGSGDNVYSAITDAGFADGKSLMFGVNQVIVIGENAAKLDIRELLSFATTYYQSHPKVKIAVCEGKASDLLSVKFKEGIVSTQKLKFIFENAEREGFAVSPTIFDVLEETSQSTESICLPLLRVKKTDSDVSEDGRTIEIKGGVVMKNGIVTNKISLDAMAGIELLLNETNETSVSLKYNDKDISIGIYNIKTEISPYMDNGQLVFSVKTNADGKYLSSQMNGENAALAENMGLLAAEQLKAKIELGAEKGVIDNGTDILLLEPLVRNRNYKLWLSLSDSWEEMLSLCRFEVETSVEIDRYGLEQ